MSNLFSKYIPVIRECLPEYNKELIFRPLDIKVPNYPYTPYRAWVSKDVVVYMFHTHISFDDVEGRTFIHLNKKDETFKIRHHWVYGWENYTEDKLHYKVFELFNIEKILTN